MTISNSNLLDLLGKTVSFNDSAFEQRLTELSLPADYPKEFLDSARSGVVIQVCYGLDGNNSLCIAPKYPSDDGADYFDTQDMRDFKVHLFVESPKPLKTLD